jgi:hypothetical protein
VSNTYHITVRDVTYVAPNELESDEALEWVRAINHYRPEGPATLNLLDPFGISDAVMAYIGERGVSDLTTAPWPLTELMATIAILSRRHLVETHTNGFVLVDQAARAAQQRRIDEAVAVVRALGTAAMNVWVDHNLASFPLGLTTPSREFNPQRMRFPSAVAALAAKLQSERLGAIEMSA